MDTPQTLRLEFVTLNRSIVHSDVDEVEVPGEAGYFGVLPGHAPLLATLQPGQFWYRTGKAVTYGFVSGGFVEVVPDRVSILAQVAEHANEIDAERADAARRRAQDRLAKPTADMDFERARIALVRAIARLEISRHSRPPRA